MDFNIEVRKKQLENLDQLISSSRSRIHSVLDFLKWDVESVGKVDPLVSCPINPQHRILPKSWNEHMKKCVIKSEGYKLNEEFLSEPPDPSNQSIYLDNSTKIAIISKEIMENGPIKLAWNGVSPNPRTADRMVSSFSADERLAFYDHAIHHTVGPPPPPEFMTNGIRHDDKPITFEEILAQQRDAKRRRAKYRSVHINKKNHTEVIREVINGQMDDYKDWLLGKDSKEKQIQSYTNSETGDNKKDEEERPHSQTSRNSNQSGSSRGIRGSNDSNGERRRRERSRDTHYTSSSNNRRGDSRSRSPYRNSNDSYRRSSSSRRHESRNNHREYSSNRRNHR